MVFCGRELTDPTLAMAVFQVVSGWRETDGIAIRKERAGKCCSELRGVILVIRRGRWC